ncbi:hypothetical protein HED50_21715 [Ochrobactrum oryzae]|nr:hypothetical protein [Brucella oryzae]
MIPHLSSLWLISMKETALLSIIGISDIVRIASLGARSTGAPSLSTVLPSRSSSSLHSSRQSCFTGERRSRQSMGGV